jgi:hypothetical protein
MLLRWGGTLGLKKRDRRRQPRIIQYFDCAWSSRWGEEHARISSLNAFGCYIESRFSVPTVGTVISDLAVCVATETLLLQGTVIDATPGIGFAVQFTQVDPHTCDCLRALTNLRRQ